MQPQRLSNWRANVLEDMTPDVRRFAADIFDQMNTSTAGTGFQTDLVAELRDVLPDPPAKPPDDQPAD